MFEFKPKDFDSVGTSKKAIAEHCNKLLNTHLEKCKTVYGVKKFWSMERDDWEDSMYKAKIFNEESLLDKKDLFTNEPLFTKK